MEPLLLPWIARGIKEDSGEYLVSLDEELKNSDTNDTVSSDRTDLPVYPNMPFTDALPILIRMRGSHTPGVIEYGCFNLDGTLIDDIELRIGRQRRNILYYMIGRMFNMSRGESRFAPGAPFGADPVSDSPEGNWAIVLTEFCPYKREIERALDALVKHRSGKIITIPKLEHDNKSQRWIEEQFERKTLPAYLLLCDSFENIPIEYQFILNSFTVTGRLWLDQPEDFENYSQKVLDVERGK